MTAMQSAHRLTVVLHDDTTTTYTDVRYTLTRAGVRILDATGAETAWPAFDVLTTHVLTLARPTSGGTQ